MNPLLKNILSVIFGFVVGSVINMALIQLSSYVIPPPEGIDVTTTEGLQASVHLFKPKHYLFPFLAHCLGTLAGAFVVVKLAATRHLKLALLIGFLFLVGGVFSYFLIPAPFWFIVVDFTAYLPAAYLGWLLGKK